MTEKIKLGDVIIDIAAGPFGSNLKVSCFVDDGFPIVDGANLKGYKLTDNITKFVTEEKARSLHRSIAKRNDCDYIIQSICPCAMYYSIYSLTFVVCMEYSVVFWE